MCTHTCMNRHTPQYTNNQIYIDLSSCRKDAGKSLETRMKRGRVKYFTSVSPFSNIA